MNKKPPKISNAKALTAVKGFDIVPVHFGNSGGFPVDAVVTPSLPQGLFIDIENNECILGGKSMEMSARTLYTVTVSNDHGAHSATIEITVIESNIKEQRSAIIAEHDMRADLDTPRSQVENALSDSATMGSTIKPHEKFMHQPMGDDKRLSQQTENNPDAEKRAQQSPELTPSPSAKLQQQAVLQSTPTVTPTLRR